MFVKPRPRLPERLFEFHLGRKLIACELRYHGEYGVEAVFMEDGLLFYSWRFDTREMAAVWAETERTAMQNAYGPPAIHGIPVSAFEPDSRRRPS
jgi:hypothetical protein